MALFYVVNLLLIAASACDLFSDPDPLTKIEQLVASGSDLDFECLHIAVKSNQLELAKSMVELFFVKGEEKRAKQAESTLRNAIEQVRHEQDQLVSIFEELAPRSIPTLSPAFRWA